MLKIIFISGWGYRTPIWCNQYCFIKKYSLSFLDLESTYSKNSNTNKFDNFKNLINKMIVNDCAIVAWSMGAILTLEYLTEFLNKDNNLKGLVIVSGTARFTEDGGYAGIPKVLVKRMMKNLKLDSNKTLSQFYRLAFTDNEIKAGYLDKLKAFQNRWKGFDRTFLHSGLEYLLNVDLRLQLSSVNIDIPILLVHGRYDEICPVFGGEFLEKSLNAADISTSKINAGHIPFFTRSNEFNDVLNKFLKNLR